MIASPIVCDKKQGSLLESLQISVCKLFNIGKLRMLIIISLSLVRGLIPGIQVFLIGLLIDAAANSYSFQYVLNSSFYLGGTIISAYLFDNLIKYLSDSITIDLSKDVDFDIVDKLCNLEVQQFETEETYDLIQRADNSTGLHIFGLFDSIRSTIQSGISIFSITLVIWSWNPFVAIMLIVAPVPSAIATLKIQTMAYTIDYNRASDRRVVSYYRSLLMSDSARKEIILFKYADILRERYSVLQKEFQFQDLKIAKYNFTIAGSLGFISIIAIIVAIVLGARSTLESGNVGALAGYISASTSIGPLMLAALVGFMGLHQHLLYISNWVAFLKLNPKTPKSGDIPYKGSDSASIEFRNVSFTYPGTSYKVLNNISFKLEAGKTTALVGLNGAGKTTIIKLLLRFYEPTSGAIFLDGRDISEYSRDTLYQHFSALFQDFVKYDRSLADNVLFTSSSDDRDVDRILKTLSMVGLKYLANLLPYGLDTMLGRRFKNGQQLSIGQWQRLAMARALYKSPSLLILDEPTASVDAISENSIFDAMSQLSRNMTTVIVAHRFTTIAHSDKIIVIKDGTVHAIGSHTELLEQSEFYRKMFYAQVHYHDY